MGGRKRRDLGVELVPLEVKHKGLFPSLESGLGFGVWGLGQT
jgi:hypothetical protein